MMADLSSIYGNLLRRNQNPGQEMVGSSDPGMMPRASGMMPEGVPMQPPPFPTQPSVEMPQFGGLEALKQKMMQNRMHGAMGGPPPEMMPRGPQIGPQPPMGPSPGPSPMGPPPSMSDPVQGRFPNFQSRFGGLPPGQGGTPPGLREGESLGMPQRPQGMGFGGQKPPQPPMGPPMGMGGQAPMARPNRMGGMKPRRRTQGGGMQATPMMGQ